MGRVGLLHPQPSLAARIAAVRRPAPKVVCRASAADVDPIFGPRVDKESLRDPAHIGTSASRTVEVVDAGGDVSLERYMRLPVEQYFVLDANSIRSLGGNRFSLQVSRMQLFDLWLEPLVEVVVEQTVNPPRVLLVAEKCRLRGSSQVEGLKLDRRFSMKMVTDMRWTSGGPGGPGAITASAQLDVWCEVVPPFNLMPREFLEASCNAVLATTTSLLLPVFLRRLAQDYQKWAADPAYRNQRALRSAPLEEVTAATY